ncbi:hypothetical protein AXF42_Ash001881 [Apostasia shenzhenica]|uniref:Uncharacterized protein n=1 Tax=Apostasia shenzhenica TaxID=1088818 RepID=A0A2I0ABI1_9ASPA|nr:hypothetical protein AXF42_Ash001881 [Apostasia shenzhenica]
MEIGHRRLDHKELIASISKPNENRLKKKNDQKYIEFERNGKVNHLQCKVLSAPGLALPYDDGRHDLLPQIRLPLLDGGHYHIPNASGRSPVETAPDPLHRYVVESKGGDLGLLVGLSSADRSSRDFDLSALFSLASLFSSVVFSSSLASPQPAGLASVRRPRLSPPASPQPAD